VREGRYKFSCIDRLIRITVFLVWLLPPIRCTRAGIAYLKPWFPPVRLFEDYQRSKENQETIKRGQRLEQVEGKLFGLMKAIN